MNLPENLKYSKEHEWVRMEGDVAVIGITDFAQSELGDIVFVQLPNVGDNVNKGDSVAVVESVKSSSDIYTPLSGEIVEVNENLEGSPELINQSPYEDGWIFKLKLSNPAELDELLDAQGYKDAIS